MSVSGKLLVLSYFCDDCKEITSAVGFDPYSVLLHMALNPLAFDLVYLGDKADGSPKERILGWSKQDVLKRYTLAHEVFSMRGSHAAPSPPRSSGNSFDNNPALSG